MGPKLPTANGPPFSEGAWLHEHVFQGHRSSEGVALGAVDTQLPQAFDDFGAMSVLSDRGDAQGMADLVDGSHQGLLPRIIQHIPDETAVDLQVVGRQEPKIPER